MKYNAIPTIYKGVKLKSRLEADMAYLLDFLGLPWEYEPQSYLFDNGIHYLPDFYLPTINTWVECRGYDTEKGNKQIDGFSEWIRQGMVKSKNINKQCSDIKCNICQYRCSSYLIISHQTLFFECDNKNFKWNTNPKLVGCEKCGEYSFVGHCGYYVSDFDSFKCCYCGEIGRYRTDGYRPLSEWHDIDLRGEYGICIDGEPFRQWIEKKKKKTNKYPFL